MGSHLRFGTGPPELVGPSALHRLAGAARRAGLQVEGGELERLYRLWLQGHLTIGRAWPDVARRSDARGRQWLGGELERYVQVFSAAVLTAPAPAG